MRRKVATSEAATLSLLHDNQSDLGCGDGTRFLRLRKVVRSALCLNCRRFPLYTAHILGFFCPRIGFSIWLGRKDASINYAPEVISHPELDCQDNFRSLELFVELNWCCGDFYLPVCPVTKSALLDRGVERNSVNRRCSGMASLTVLLLVICLALVSIVEGGVLFSSLNRTLSVTSQIQSAAGSPPEIAKAGVDHIAVQWSLNSSFAGLDAMYAKVNIKLCFAPPSQVDRGWRKTKNDLHKDKTCSAATIASQRYTPAGNSTVWLVAKKVPKALYFVRAYAVDENGVQLAFGQTTNKAKSSNLFAVDPITGRHTSIDIASAVFSVAAVGSLISYLGFETLMAKRKESS